MKERNINCDILRIIAFSFVISVHSFFGLNFYKTITEGPTMLALNIIRCLFLTCVPLFMVITGYLMSKKEFNKKYLKKITRIVITYILCSIVCLIALTIIEHREILSLKDYLFSILSFQAAPYSWYVNMYLGLYLLIPFLNILWNNLKTKENKKNLIIVLLVLITLPTIFNIWNFDNLEWWLRPSSSNIYQTLIPNYWTGNCYPILYYFIGCYLKEFKLNISTMKNLILLILGIIVFGAFNYYRNCGAIFNDDIYLGYCSIEVVTTTTLLANLILNNTKVKITNLKIKKVIAKISYLTFGAYLVSAIFDSWYYKSIAHIDYIKNRLIYWIPLIIAVIISSLILSYFISIIEKLLLKMAKNIKQIKNEKISSQN